MHMQVNITDLCILLFYSLGRLTWLSTWQWHAGLLSCRLMRLLEQFAFASSSNVLVVIAIERMYSLCRPFTVCARVRAYAPHCDQAPHFTATYVPGLLGAAYIIAFAMAAPQYYFWSLYTPPCAVDSWTQCLDIFTIVIRDTVDNATVDAAISSQHVYMLYSTIVMFWAPAIVIVVSVLYGSTTSCNSLHSSIDMLCGNCVQTVRTRVCRHVSITMW